MVQDAIGSPYDYHHLRSNLSTDRVEADVSDGLDQLDEAVSGLTSGKLKPSWLHSFKSYLYHTR